MTQLFLTLSLALFLFAGPEKTEVSQNNYVSFTLHNSSARSIPLRIPGVMNPNLSPFSDSGVTLQVGQKIFYHPKGKKRSLGEKKILLIVSEDLADQKLDVAQLIKKLKKSSD